MLLLEKEDIISKYRFNVLLLVTSHSSYLWKLHYMPERVP